MVVPFVLVLLNLRIISRVTGLGAPAMVTTPPRIWSSVWPIKLGTLFQKLRGSPGGGPLKVSVPPKSNRYTAAAAATASPSTVATAAFPARSVTPPADTVNVPVTGEARVRVTEIRSAESTASVTAGFPLAEVTV